MTTGDLAARRRCLLAATGFAGGTLLPPPSRAQSGFPPVTAFPSGRWNPGRWVSVDLFTDDTPAAARFYSAVFGWTFEPTGGMGGRYWLVRAGDEHVGAVVPRDAGPGAERGNRWMPIMSVEDVSRAADAGQRSGGRVAVAPITLPGRGEVAVLTDPEGTPFGVIRALGGDPDDYLAEINEWVWLELWAADPDRAARFYAPLGGCEVEQDTDDAGKPLLQLSSGDSGRASIRPTPFPKLPPAWIPFVRVADAGACAALVRALGGRVVIEPRADRLAGRVAVCVDPGGAPFGVLALPQEVA